MQERKIAEKRASETIRHIGEGAREAAGRAQESSARALDGLREYQLKVLSATQANINAMFEYAQDILQAQSVSELIETSTTHSRRQFELMSEQARELASSAQKIATQTAQPLTAFGNPFKEMS